jgi:hypothetical protein
VVCRSAIPFAAALTCACLLLAGCGDTWTNVKRGLGMEKVVPDEFAVTASAPLAIPPDFSLRPPRPGAAPTQEMAPVDQARQTVFRASDTQLTTLAPASSDRSSGEGEFLKQAGAENAPQNIRELVANEASLAPDKSGFVDSLLFWRTAPPSLPPANQVIDPSSEAERLRAATANQTAANAPAQPAATAANTPVIERTKSKGFFNWLF